MNSQPVKKKNKALALIKPIPLSGLDKFKRLARAEAEIDDELHKLGNLSQAEDIGQLIHLICNLVENISSVKLNGQEKKDFVVKKLINIDPIYNNETDLKWVNILIDTLCLIGSVSKVATSKEVIQGVKSICGSFFFKKLIIPFMKSSMKSFTKQIIQTKCNIPSVTHLALYYILQQTILNKSAIFIILIFI